MHREELIANKSGDIYIIDVGPRNGGNYLPRFFSYISGDDIVEATLRIAVGDPSGLKHFEQSKDGLWVQLIASVTPTYGGMSHARLDDDETAGRGLQWPCPSAEHPGTPILHMGEFAQGLGAFSTPDYQPSAELPDAEYPLVMMTGRILYQYNACAMTARTDGVNEIDPCS